MEGFTWRSCSLCLLSVLHWHGCCKISKGTRVRKRHSYNSVDRTATLNFFFFFPRFFLCKEILGRFWTLHDESISLSRYTNYASIAKYYIPVLYSVHANSCVNNVFFLSPYPQTHMPLSEPV